MSAFCHFEEPSGRRRISDRFFADAQNDKPTQLDGYEIRAARKDDIPYLLILYEPLAAVSKVSLSLKLLEEELAGPHSIFRVACWGQDRVGFISGRVLDGGREGEIRFLAVCPGRSRQGIASGLLNAFLSNFQPGSPIYLEVAETNHAALAFYEKSGAGKIALRKNYYKDCGAWVMRLQS